MCGRFRLSKPVKQVADLFKLDSPPDILLPKTEFPPSVPILTVSNREDGTGRELVLREWGFVPHWMKNLDDFPHPFNAVGETVASKSMFRRSFKSRRCIVPADGFIEWPVVGDGSAKQKTLIGVRGAELIGMAGLWDEWVPKDGGELLSTATIITATPNAFMRPIHHRMPVVLMPEDYDAWLDTETPPERLFELLQGCPPDGMVAEPLEDPKPIKKPRARKAKSESSSLFE